VPRLPTSRRWHASEQGVKRLAAAWALAALASCAHKPSATESFPKRAYYELHGEGVGPWGLYPDNLNGKVVMVTFFATWCFPCLAEMPVIVQLQNQHRADGFEVVAVGMDLEGAKVLGPFADHYQYPFPVVVADERLRKGETSFGRISALPTHFFFGREGQLLVAYQGAAPPGELERVVKQLLVKP
jgi:thiol-disulfide isomerase/thioredoxin